MKLTGTFLAAALLGVGLLAGCGKKGPEVSGTSNQVGAPANPQSPVQQQQQQQANQMAEQMRRQGQQQGGNR